MDLHESAKGAMQYDYRVFHGGEKSVWECERGRSIL